MSQDLQGKTVVTDIESARRLYHPRCMLISPITAGTGRTGYLQVPPNNYPFYSDEEKYVPVMQSDGGQLSGTSAHH